MRFFLILYVVVVTLPIGAQDFGDPMIGKINWKAKGTKLTRILEPPFKRLNEHYTFIISARLFHTFYDASDELNIDGINLDTSTTLVGDTLGYVFQNTFIRNPEESPSILGDTYLSSPISNKEYREFEAYVLDSTVRSYLKDNPMYSSKWGVPVLDDNNDTLPIDQWNINWDVDRNSPEYQDILKWHKYIEQEQLNGVDQIDKRKLVYNYFWIDIKSAAMKGRTQVNNPKGQNGAIRGHFDRSHFIVQESVCIMRDTLAWWTTSLPDRVKRYLCEYYSWHPVFDNYPAIGINASQTQAFISWKNYQTRKFLNSKNVFRHAIISLPYKMCLESLTDYDTCFTLKGENNDWWYIDKNDYMRFHQTLMDTNVNGASMRYYVNSMIDLNKSTANGPYDIFSDENERNWYVVKEACEGKDLIIDFVNTHGHGNGVRSFYHRECTFINQTFLIRPIKDANTFETLSWEEAQAYYYWKRSLLSSKKKNKDPLYLLMPTKEEFMSLQNGKRMPKSSEITINYPSPLVRFMITN